MPELLAIDIERDDTRVAKQNINPLAVADRCMRRVTRLAGKRWKPTDTELQQAMRDSDRRRSSG